MFTGFQVNLYADDVEPGVAFYAAMGFDETYRYALAGEPLHVELSDGGLTIGIASVRAARDEHGLEVSQDGGDGDRALVRGRGCGIRSGTRGGSHGDERAARLPGGPAQGGLVMDPLGNPLELVQDLER